MRDKLINYVELLFAGTQDSDDIKQEILQNTLDRYDDLISQGKAPEAAYQLAITGIGDINEILGVKHSFEPQTETIPRDTLSKKQDKPAWKKILQAVGICLYVLCPIPLFIIQNEIGLCGLLGIAAIATAFMVISGSSESKKDAEKEKESAPRTDLEKSLNNMVWVLGLIVYFAISFFTGAWYITWVIFPLIGSINGLIKACFDLKEANKNEI